jgi:hypothetical protein
MKIRANGPRVTMILVSALLAVMLFGVFAVEAKEININKRGDLVWMGYDWNDGEIYLYSRGTIAQITDNEHDDTAPQINDKGEMLWLGNDGNNYEIHLYSRRAITQITHNDYDDCFRE